MVDGREVELDVLRIAHGGVAVAELGGRVVFVADTLPGERVLARITDDRHDRFWRAETLRVIEGSADRVPHIWADASLDRPPEQRAGGAEFGHIAPARQRTLKEEVLRDALGRIGGLPQDRIAALDPHVIAVPGRHDGLRSRTRVRLHVDRSGRVGPFAARSKRVVPVHDLPLAVESLQGLLPATAVGREVDLVAASSGSFAAGRRDARPPITERVGEREFRLEALGFWQVHPAAPAVLTAAVRAAVDPALLDPDADNLDLYGGVGLLAAALAGDADVRVTTVESDGAASAHAAANLADLPRARAVEARVDAFLAARQQERPGATVLLDPPRSGAGRDIVEAIVAARPAQIVYVACDPVALARDLGTFAAHGWQAVTLDAFDLFPNTHHLEAVARLVREE
ncbi:class I SAM-dependent RNA methyltransferase [uncultured Amnibacterium sp.]|uniref:class I SAM-dependent RNA methyltransferase n=1 Tax=uncultured Amnibacterium sp. TaxID=1631851 RepID=UPI0035CC6A11